MIGHSTLVTHAGSLIRTREELVQVGPEWFAAEMQRDFAAHLKNLRFVT
jgi:hypothetical protein